MYKFRINLNTFENGDLDKPTTKKQFQFQKNNKNKIKI